MSMRRWDWRIDDEDENEDEDADLSDYWIDVVDEEFDVSEWDDEDWDDYADSIKDDNTNLVDMSGWCVNRQKLLDARDQEIESLKEEIKKLRAEVKPPKPPLSYAAAIHKGICVPLKLYIEEILGEWPSNDFENDVLRMIEHRRLTTSERGYTSNDLKCFGPWLKKFILDHYKWKQEQG